jgi:hypothetical protein
MNEHGQVYFDTEVPEEDVLRLRRAELEEMRRAHRMHEEQLHAEAIRRERDVRDAFEELDRGPRVTWEPPPD